MHIFSHTDKQTRLWENKKTKLSSIGWVGKANLTGNILPALTVVKRPLWVLTGSVTAVVVSTGASVVTTSGRAVVLRSTTVVGAGRVGRSVGSGGGGGGTIGTRATGVVATVGTGFFRHTSFHL